jgi:hypothetical protein
MNSVDTASRRSSAAGRTIRQNEPTTARRRRHWAIALVVALAGGIAYVVSAAPGERQGLLASLAMCSPWARSLTEAPYLAESDAAMSKMMKDMALKPTGDVDHDFVAMMVPHHQGAIEMAQAVLRYGHNEQVRRIAQEIIVDQLQEIAAMRLATGDPLPASIASPTQPPPSDGIVAASIKRDPIQISQEY